MGSNYNAKKKFHGEINLFFEIMIQKLQGYSYAYLKRMHEQYMAKMKSPLNKKRSLNQSNLFTEAYAFFMEQLYPLNPCEFHISTILKCMINSGKYLLGRARATFRLPCES